MNSDHLSPRSAPAAARPPARALSVAAALLVLALAQGANGPAAAVENVSDRLTSRPRPAAPAAKPAAVGDEVHTAAGQRRRLVLPDGSALYVNEQTTVKLTAPRQLTLS